VTHPGLLLLGIPNLGLAALEAYQGNTGRRLSGRQPRWSNRTAAIWAIAFGFVGVVVTVFAFIGD
jgi:hypothetical protein